jgi:hypothetical protein
MEATGMDSERVQVIRDGHADRCPITDHIDSADDGCWIDELLDAVDDLAAERARAAAILATAEQMADLLASFIGDIDDDAEGAIVEMLEQWRVLVPRAGGDGEG